jgi:hypothetical protein
MDIAIFDFLEDFPAFLKSEESSINEQQSKLLSNFFEKIMQFTKKNHVYLNRIPIQELIEQPQWKEICDKAKEIILAFIPK